MSEDSRTDADGIRRDEKRGRAGVARPQQGLRPKRLPGSYKSTGPEAPVQRAMEEAAYRTPQRDGPQARARLLPFASRAAKRAALLLRECLAEGVGEVD